jgi:hypothetical protein
MIWNALQATMVRYATAGTSITTSDGTTITTGGSAATDVTNDADAQFKANGKLELVEKCFPKLSVNSSSNDSFGRPTTVYTFGSNDISTVVETPVATFTAATTAAKVKAAIGATLSNTETDTDDDGVMDSTFGADVAALTLNGKIVEVYADQTVVEITPIFAQVTVITNKETTTHGANTQYDVTGITTSGKVYSSVVDEDSDVDNVVITGTVADGDYVLAYTDGDGTTGSTLYITAVKTVTGAITSKTSAGVITLGGTTYQVANGVTNYTAASSYSVNADTEISAYVDANGFLLGQVAATPDSTKYALVVSCNLVYVSGTSGNKMTPAYEATIVTAAGELKTVTASASVANDAVYTYTINTKGEYVFTDVLTNASIDGTAGSTREHATATEITKKAFQMTGDARNMNNKTVFCFVNYDADGNATSVTTYTGIGAVPTIKAFGSAGSIFAIDTTATADGIIDLVYVNANTSDPADVVDYVYYMGSFVQNATGYVIDVIVGGEQTTMTVSDRSYLADHTLYASIDTDGTVTNVSGAVTSIQNVNGAVWINGSDASSTYDVLEDDVPVYIINTTTDTVTTKTATYLESAIDTGSIYLVVTNTTTISAVYVVVS